jgi:hypothetical protein
MGVMALTAVWLVSADGGIVSARYDLVARTITPLVG